MLPSRVITAGEPEDTTQPPTTKEFSWAGGGGERRKASARKGREGVLVSYKVMQCVAVASIRSAPSPPPPPLTLSPSV